MSSPIKNIAILESSDIIYSGLYCLIMKGAIRYRITQHNSIATLSEEEIDMDTTLIINPRLLDGNDKALTRIRKKHPEVRCIALVHSFVDDELLQRFDYIHKINTPAETLLSYLNSKASSNFNVNKELSEREIDVLKLLTKGLANKEIADQLFISTHTVISHRKNIIEKTGIKSLPGLTIYAISKGITSINEEYS